MGNEVSVKENGIFHFDVIKGLTQEPKHLPSKYFYDKNGDGLFQAIMMSPDYYLISCEMEIFTCHTRALAESVAKQGTDFELIELSPRQLCEIYSLLKAFTASKV